MTALRAAALALGALGLLAIATCKSGDAGNAGGSGGSGNAGGSGGAGGGAGVETCGTCAQVFTNGGAVCGGTASSHALTALQACACQGPCAADCAASLCGSAPSDARCGACLETSCAAAQMDCAAR